MTTNLIHSLRGKSHWSLVSQVTDSYLAVLVELEFETFDLEIFSLYRYIIPKKGQLVHHLLQ